MGRLSNEPFIAAIHSVDRQEAKNISSASQSEFMRIRTDICIVFIFIDVFISIRIYLVALETYFKVKKVKNYEIFGYLQKLQKMRWQLCSFTYSTSPDKRKFIGLKTAPLEAPADPRGIRDKCPTQDLELAKFAHFL